MTGGKNRSRRSRPRHLRIGNVNKIDMIVEAIIMKMMMITPCLWGVTSALSMTMMMILAKIEMKLMFKRMMVTPGAERNDRAGLSSTSPTLVTSTWFLLCDLIDFPLVCWLQGSRGRGRRARGGAKLGPHGCLPRRSSSGLSAPAQPPRRSPRGRQEAQERLRFDGDV